MIGTALSFGNIHNVLCDISLQQVYESSSLRYNKDYGIHTEMDSLGNNA